MNQSHLLQNNLRLPSKPISSNKSADVVSLVQLSGESAETLDYFAAIHQNEKLTKQTALDLFAGVARSK
jgi:hypothetical protein